MTEGYEKYTSVSELEIDDLKTKKEKVAFLLNRYPETRNTDKLLWLKYLEIFHGLDAETTSLDMIASGELPAQTTVARARAELQNKHSLYLPTRPDVMVKRQGRRRAYERVFQKLDDLDESSFTETSIYSDESGLTHDYLLYGFFMALNGRDAWELVKNIMDWTSETSSKKAYFHFQKVGRSEVDKYLSFIKMALETTSARAFIHIFDKSRLVGKEKDILFNAYKTSAIETIRKLQSEGIIDENHRVKLILDRSQDQIFYRSLEQSIEPRLSERKIGFEGVEDLDSKDSFLVQVADVITGAFGRAVNTPGSTHKDELSRAILDYCQIGNPLKTQRSKHFSVINHSSP